MDLQEAIRRAHKRHRLFPSGMTVIVAVSGGRDSLALLHALYTLVSEKTLAARLLAATFDHQLRGAAGALDARFVAESAARMSIPCEIGSADVAALAQARSAGLEEAARYARYRFLAQVARDHGGPETCIVATGHHADDQAETILMRLLRGAGLEGLAGMRTRAPLPYAEHFTLVRPMLFATRAMVDAYCAAHDLTPRIDTTNDDMTLTRNAIRLRTLPALEADFPGTTRHLVQLGELAGIDRDFFAQALASQALVYVSQADRRVSIGRAHYRSLHQSLRLRLILYVSRILTLRSDKQAGFEQVLAADDILMASETGSRVELPGGVRVTLERENIVFTGESTQI